MNGKGVDRANVLGNRDIVWEQMDKTRFFLTGSTLLVSARSLVYPAQLLKTNIIMHQENALRGLFGTFRHIIKNDGFFGLYRGFFVSAFGIVPAQALYITSYELTRSKVRKFLQKKQVSSPLIDFLPSGAGGVAASLSSQLVIIPVDVVAQRLMLQRKNTEVQYKNGFDALKKILKQDGIRGIYRGLVPSILTYIPSSGIWWGTYGVTKKNMHDLVDHIRRDVQPTKFENVAVQISSALASSCVSVTITHPMDVIKTRLQVGSNKSMVKVFQNLISQEGLKGFTKGWTARLMGSAPTSSLMVLIYELTKQISLRKERH